MYSFDEVNQLFMGTIEPKIRQFLEKGFSGEVDMALPSFPNVAFSNLSFFNYSIIWNETRIDPTKDPQVFRYTSYVDYYNCAFSYEYGIKKGNGTLLMEGVFLNFSFSVNFSNGIGGLGFEVFIVGSPSLVYAGMQFDLANEAEFTDGVNFVCDALPTNILNNVVSGLRERIPDFINGMVTDPNSWTDIKTLGFANLDVIWAGRVLNITSVQLEDQGLTYSFLNVSLVLNMTSQPTSAKQ